MKNKYRNYYLIIIIFACLFFTNLFTSNINANDTSLGYYTTDGSFENSFFYFIIGVFYILVCMYCYNKNYSTFLLLLILSPFSTLIVGYFSKGVVAFSLLPFILFLFLLVSGKGKLNVNIDYCKKVSDLALVYLLLLLSLFITMIINEKNLQNAMIWCGYLMSSFALFICLLIVKKKKIDYKDILNGIFMCLVFLSCIIIFQIIILGILNNNLGALFLIKRSFSFPSMSNSNYTIVILIILFMYLLINSAYLEKKQRYLLWIILLIDLTFAQSRGATISFFVIISLYGINKGIKKIIQKKIKLSSVVLIGMGILICVSIILFFFKNNVIENLRLVQRFEAMFSGNDINVSSRSLMWKQYLDQYYNGDFKQMIFGFGVSNQVGLIRRPHNLYVLLVHQIGLVGLLIFAFCIINYMKKNPSMRYIMLFILIDSCFEPLLFTVWVDSFLFTLSFIEYLKNTSD